jgi:hypothetical protein
LTTPDLISSSLSGGIESISSASYKRSLFTRRSQSIGSQLGCGYLLHTLRSYPYLMLSDTLPPFIHHIYRDFDNTGFPRTTGRTASTLTEPLAICKSIMHMYSSKTKESSAFVWRTIQMELTRLDKEVSSELQFCNLPEVVYDALCSAHQF